MIELTALSRDIRFFNGEKGFESPKKHVTMKLLLAISEIAEAQEELRDGHAPGEIYYERIEVGSTGPVEDITSLATFERKPCGFLVELADAAIRLMDIGAAYGLDLTIVPDIFDTGDDVYEDLLYVCHLISKLSDTGLTELRHDEEILNEAIGRLFRIAYDYIEKTSDKSFIVIIKEKLAFNRTRPAKHGRVF